MEGVRRLSKEAVEHRPNIHVLINNAGAVFRKRQLSLDGYEMTLALNHLSPFLLTNLLLPALVRAAASKDASTVCESRIVTVASDAAKGAWIDFDDLDGRHSYRAFRAYGQSKLANILFTQELSRRLSTESITANCCHPGFVGTGFNRNNGLLLKIAMTAVRPFIRSPDKGAETLVFLAASPDVSGVTGEYFFDCHRGPPPEAIYEPEIAAELWRVSAEMTGLNGGERD